MSTWRAAKFSESLRCRDGTTTPAAAARSPVSAEGSRILYGENGDLIDAATRPRRRQPADRSCSKVARRSPPASVQGRHTGVVAYYGFTPQEGVGPENNSWFVKTAGISLDSGGDAQRRRRQPERRHRRSRRGPAGQVLRQRQDQRRVDVRQPRAACGRGQHRVHRQRADRSGRDRLSALLGGGLVGPLFNARPAMTYRGRGTMTDVATTTVEQQLVKKTHPVRGILWGLMMGWARRSCSCSTKVIPLALVLRC